MNLQKTNNEDISYNKVTLAFPQEEEILFQKKYFSDSIVQFRLAWLLVIFLYGSFGYVDTLMFPEYSKLFHTIRYAIVIPLLSVVLLFSFTKSFSKYWQFLILICYIVGGTGIGIMTILLPENYTYYAGMMLIYSAGYLFVKLRFFYASVAGWLTLLIFNLLAIYYTHMPVESVLIANFFFISANLIGMFAAYNFEYNARRSFSLNMKLDMEKLAITELNTNLEKIIDDRTKELVRAKEQAEISELQFKNLFEGAPDAIFIADAESGIILEVNHSAEKLMQLPKDKIIGLHQSKLHPSELKEHSINTFLQRKKEQKETEHSTDLENSIIRPDGTKVPVEIVAAKTTYHGKKCLAGTFRDTTERKKAQTELLQTKKALEAYNSKLTAILEGTEESIWAFNRNYEILYINHVFQQEFYHSFGVLLQPGVNLVESLPAPLIPFWKPRYDKVLQNEQYTVEDAVDTENGTLHIQVTFNPIIKNGKVVGGSCFGSNITPRKLSELELIKAKERAEESDRLKSAFLANMSHEIRTPMNGILGFAELLKEPNLKGEEQLEYISIIEKSGMRMLSIINDIIDISKIESGLMEVNISTTDINEQLEDIYSFFKPEAEYKGLKLNLSRKLSIEGLTINTDKEKLYAVLTNLVKNAIKYTNKGFIEFGYQQTEKHIEFYVKDSGIGIAKDRQEAIFERFIQADISDKMALQGAGLGLAISKAFTTMLGGEMWMESEPGKGSTFYFTIPLSTKNNDKINNENSEKENIDHSALLGLKILLADDDKTSISLIRKIVDKISSNIIETENGEDAVEQCRKNPDIDLILLDIKMPGFNGYEATRRIREFNKEVVIIAQTAFGLAGDKEKAMEAGCNDYIAKPINRLELLSLIQKYFVKDEDAND